MPKRWMVPVMPIDSQYRWMSSSPTRSTTIPVHVLSLTMIIMTRASRKVIQNPGVRCWNVPESLSWYLASIVTFWSSASLPAWTPPSAAIMIEIFRVLADGTGTSPSRSARAPVARSFRYQLAWKFAASHSSLRRFTRSRIDWLLSFPSAPYLGPAPHERAQPEPRNGAVDGLTAAPAHRRVAQHGDRADPRHDDRHRRRRRLDSL